jgi:hypothetical protein
MDRDVWADSDDELHESGQASNEAEAKDGAPNPESRKSEYDRKMAEREWNKLHRLHGVVGFNSLDVF